MDYFKHYSTAGEGNTLNHLFEEFGHHGYAYWFLLLELCNHNWDGKSEPSFTFFESIVRKKLRISSTKLKLFLNFCSTKTELSFNISGKDLNIHIPMLLEVKTSRNVIKSNKNQLTVYIEENRERIEENRLLEAPEKNLPEKNSQEILRKPSPLSFLFQSAPEIQSWLDAGTHETHMMLIKKYSHHELVDLVEKAYAWAIPKGQRAESWLYTFVSNKTTSGYGFNKGQKKNSLVTPDNPTGDPYLAQIIEMERQQHG